MKNDPIKDFVEQHREEFDHLEAPVLKLDQLKTKLQQVPQERKRSPFIFHRNRWLVAASMLMMLSFTYFFFHSSVKEKPQEHLAKQKTNVPANKNVSAHKNVPVDEVERASTLIIAKATVPQDIDELQKMDKPQSLKGIVASENTPKTNKSNAPAIDIYARLKDSTSASSRLLAILEIEKADRIDNQLIDKVETLLNHDPNTNVRLAALNLLEKYKDNEHVSALLVSSLEKQKDPIVQLGLVSLLGNMKNIKINDKLEMLASSPDTFAAVRDEAYAILLDQNKLQ